MTGKSKASNMFLYNYGGPVIRREAAARLGIPADNLRTAVAGTPLVRYWIGCLEQSVRSFTIHGAMDTCFENAMYKLLSFGIQERDDSRLPVIGDALILALEQRRGDIKLYDSISSIIISIWLSRMERNEEIVREIAVQRLEAVYGFIKNHKYNIYVSPGGYPAIPRQRVKHPLVNPHLYENNVWRLPSVHDMFLFARPPACIENADAAADEIARYVLDERYQQLEHGYWLMLAPQNKYYSMGWPVHLDRFSPENGRPQGGVLWAAELMSRFPSARASGWFRDTMAYLESCGASGVYLFPPECLRESRDKYYVGGGHMGLGEDRKKALSLKLESTAWMVRNHGKLR